MDTETLKALADELEEVATTYHQRILAEEARAAANELAQSDYDGHDLMLFIEELQDELSVA